MRRKLLMLTIMVAALAGVNLFFVLKNPEVQTDGQARLAPLIPVAQAAQVYVLPVSEPSYLPILDTNLSKPSIGAAAALVYDARSSRLLYAKNTSAQLPVASLTKILTAATVLDLLNLDDVATIEKTAIKVDEEKQDLYLGERITVRNLLSYMLIPSSNDAAYALADYAKTQGIDLVVAMNKKAAELGMGDSNFLDPAGLNDEAYSTAYDMSVLVGKVISRKEIWSALTQSEITITSADGAIVHRLKNTNQLLSTVPNVKGGKTGYTEKALGCMILLVDVPGRQDTLVSIVLGSSDRFGDTKKLIDWTLAAYRWE